MQWQARESNVVVACANGYPNEWQKDTSVRLLDFT